MTSQNLPVSGPTGDPPVLAHCLNAMTLMVCHVSLQRTEALFDPSFITLAAFLVLQAERCIVMERRLGSTALHA
eukprot:g29633.t1